jgi:predicted nucleic acid-binding Zn ribbon protein
LKAERAGRRRSDAKGKKHQPVHVGAALAELAASLGIDGTLRRYTLLAGWAQVVGEQIARVTEPQRIENGVLFVHVKTAPWRAELSLKRVEIIKKLNAAAGADVLRDIRFR